MHRCTEWRRKKREGEGAPVRVKLGRRVSEAVPSADLLGFTCAVVGELVEHGEARLGYLKVFRRIKSGPHPGEAMEDYLERRLREADSQVNPAPVPVWRDCPSPQKEAIVACKEFSPMLLALAAASLGQFVYLQKAGAELQVRELDAKSLEDEIREGEPDMRQADLTEIVKASLENPEIARVYLGASDLTKYYHGHSARRESSQASSPSAVMKSQGIDISRRMVSFYRAKPEFEAAKEWLRQLIGHSISRVPVVGGELTVREDLRSGKVPIVPISGTP